mgnify:CR=1 FL=1
MNLYWGLFRYLWLHFVGFVNGEMDWDVFKSERYAYVCISMNRYEVNKMFVIIVHSSVKRG